MASPVYSTLARSFAHRVAVERQRGVGAGLVLQQPRAAGVEALARRLVGRRDEQRRDAEVADLEPRFAQPPGGAERGAALVEPEPAADQGQFARRIDAHIGGVAALDAAGLVLDQPVERHWTVEPGILGR